MTARAGRAERRGGLRRDPRTSSRCCRTGTSAGPGTASGTASPPASQAAFDTLYTVLETTTRVVAPLLPLTAEEIWRGLTGGRSVHLTDWPACALSLSKDVEASVTAMDRVREVCSTGSALRKAEGLRVRLPLASLTVVADDADGAARRSRS